MKSLPPMRGEGLPADDRGDRRFGQRRVHRPAPQSRLRKWPAIWWPPGSSSGRWLDSVYMRRTLGNGDARSPPKNRANRSGKKFGPAKPRPEFWEETSKKGSKWKAFPKSVPTRCKEGCGSCANCFQYKNIIFFSGAQNTAISAPIAGPRFSLILLARPLRDNFRATEKRLSCGN